MKILAVTACPSGVAHTYMAAEALEKAAKAKGIEIKVETQGSIGIENKITMDDVKDADVVILTKDIGIKETERFSGLPTVKVGVSDVVKKSDQIIDKVEAYVNSKKQ
ncbi:PTS fructose-like transporter subunit IIB [Clostridium sp. AWRP]|uniref:PTS fructose-like transporter subunit IIB n=1 Tax=Clostridium sp. AWRP TaxID=2212991 RepID=UPI000FD6F20A|nr:PTS fructose-like transporter subunit IIB [Clostridium sp. AWRP]AZV57547.1 PTS fructose-like transporter subunit IIB [Clostridium sp. AWRP]